ncbi:hypothetical protein [Ekhidna sp.]|uniref:hypothetical protein n=1 Tax=Ekhidna sp. TaxID=2608089 RepID=UPI0035193151
MGITIIGLIALALCIIPFVLVHNSIKNNKQDLINGLRSIADSYNSDISSYDCGIEFSIGISSANNYIFYYKKRKGTISEECVPLNAIRKCQVDSAKRTVNAKSGNETIIDKLELTFIPKDGNVAPSRLAFFDSNEHFKLNGELPLIRKWEAITNKFISH